MYLVTHIVTFRAHRNRCDKTRFAGNIENIGKKRNAVAAVSVGSLRASRQRPTAALRFLDVAPEPAPLYRALCLRKRALLWAFGDSLKVTI